MDLWGAGGAFPRARLGPEGFEACFRKRILLIQHLIHLAPSVAFNDETRDDDDDDGV